MDPAIRAEARLDSRMARERAARLATAITLGGLALAGPLVAEPATGDPGATVGAVVAGLLLVALSISIWPQNPSAEEKEHFRLEAIWRELRGDADLACPYERFAAWAEQSDGSVELMLIRCAPAIRRIAGAPTPYSWEVVRRVTAGDPEAAAESMEELRAEAAASELAASQRVDHEETEAERLAHERSMEEIDRVAALELEEREEQLRREFAEREATERRADAAALARALRRP